LDKLPEEASAPERKEAKEREKGVLEEKIEEKTRRN
jgi:hypothetical protein